MKKILIIFTGGTIGSKSSNGMISVEPKMRYRLIEEYRLRRGGGVEFEAAAPLNLLSENLMPKDWNAIYKEITRRDLSDFEGIIITHGSDTLPYSAAALSYLLAGITIPVIFVASNYRLDDPKSNGADNFTAAVDYIVSGGAAGIFAVFRGKSGKMNFYLGTRILEADCVFDDFSPYAQADFGELDGSGGFIYNKPSPLNPDAEQLKERACGLNHSRLDFTQRILCVRPYPGLDYSAFDLDALKPAALLHTLYHSSTACTIGQESSMLNFCHQCLSLGIDVYLLDCKHTILGNIYKSAEGFSDKRLYKLSGISFEAALSKLYIAYAQRELSPQEYMTKNIFFEFADIKSVCP